MNFKQIFILDDLSINVYADGRIETLDKIRIRSNGRKDNRKGKFIKPAIDKYGYYRCTFSHNGKRKSYYAHRLVAMAFIPNDEDKPTVNHKNGNKLDNRVENLEWATQHEQKIHSINHGLCIKNINALADSNLRKSIAVFFNGELYSSLNSARKATKIHSSTIKKYGKIKEVMQNG